MDIGKNMVRLRHPTLADIKKRSPGTYWLVVVVCVFFLAVGVLLNAESLPGVLRKLAQHDWRGLNRLDIDTLGFVVILLILALTLPWTRALQAKITSQQLLVGELGMLLVSREAPSLPETKSRAVLWSDLAKAQLIYRRVDGAGVGVLLVTKDGRRQFLSASRWVKDDAPGSEVLMLGKSRMQMGMAKERLEFLRKSDLVQILEAQGLQLEDDPKRLSDTVAVSLGLVLAAVVVIFALVYEYLH